MGPLAVAVHWAATPLPVHLLGAAERRCLATKPAWRRRQWTAGRLTARIALRTALGDVPTALAILPDADGAPVAHACDYVVSLSHTDEWAACVCGPADRRYGIDIESSTACDDQLLARVSAADEAPVDPLSPTSGWARKEAAYKACRGSPPLLRDYRLTGPNRITAVHREPSDQLLFSWVTSLPDAVVALASDNPNPIPLQVFDAHTAMTILDGAPAR